MMRATTRVPAALLLFGLAVTGGAGPAAAQGGKPADGAVPTLAARDIARQATPAVVTLRALRGGHGVASGSGFLIRPEGVLVTNVHVIQDADHLQVELATGEIFDAVYLLAADARRDVAVLKIPSTQLPTLDVGDASGVAVGDPVFVVGNPLGMDRTFSDGLVSARRVIDGVAYLQITAPVSEGSSGGPVLDGAGRVIGITTASVTEGQNLNMAVPIGYAEGLLSVASDPVPFPQAAASLRGAVGDPPSAGRPQDRPEPASRDLEDPRLDGLEPWERVVAEQLIAIARQLESEGFVATDQSHFATLAPDSIHYLDLELPHGVYRAVAVCDQDCSDIDLQVADLDGTILDTDILDDDVPIVDFLAPATDTFRFAVQIITCTTPTCFYGLQLYRKE